MNKLFAKKYRKTLKKVYNFNLKSGTLKKEPYYSLSNVIIKDDFISAKFLNLLPTLDLRTILETPCPVI